MSDLSQVVAGRKVKFVNQGDAKAETSVVSTSEKLYKYKVETDRFSLVFEEKESLDTCRIVVSVQDT